MLIFKSHLCFLYNVVFFSAAVTWCDFMWNKHFCSLFCTIDCCVCLEGHVLTFCFFHFIWNPFCFLYKIMPFQHEIFWCKKYCFCFHLKSCFRLMEQSNIDFYFGLTVVYCFCVGDHFPFENDFMWNILFLYEIMDQIPYEIWFMWNMFSYEINCSYCFYFDFTWWQKIIVVIDGQYIVLVYNVFSWELELDSPFTSLSFTMWQFLCPLEYWVFSYETCIKCF